MRILYTVTAFPREAGDVITPWLIETIQRLRAQEVEVEVLAPSYRGLGDQVVNGIRVHRFRYAPKGLETLTHDQTAPDRIRERPAYLGLVPGYVAAGAWAASRLARTGGFDVVHVFWPLPHGLFGLAARRAAGIPLVTTFFGVELSWVRAELPLLAPLMRGVIRRSDAVTAISTYTAREVQRLAPEVEVRRIPFGAAGAGSDSELNGPRERVAGSPFRLLFVGRLVERKGVEVLLRAVARLGRDLDVRLTVVGEGPLRPLLEGRVQALGIGDRVEFAGLVPGPEISGYFLNCDALVLPAIRDGKGDVEGLGVVLIEALLHDRPVIASDSGGIPDIVQDGRTGLLVPPGDDAALASAIRRFIDEPGLRDRLAAEGRRHVSLHFSWEAIIAELVDLYHGLQTRSTATARPRLTNGST